MQDSEDIGELLISVDLREEEFPYEDIEEDIIFVIDRGESIFPIVGVVVSSNLKDKGKYGYCSFENGEGNLDSLIGLYLNDDMEEGMYIMRNASIDYIRGDGWEIDDDIELNYTSILPVTDEERAFAESEW